MPILRQELDHYLADILLRDFCQDYGPNGLQIEGKETVGKIGFAVTASRSAIEKAIEDKCDALIVHHGLFWSFHGPKTITGPFAKRVVPLIRNEINLFAYHLPLDGHADIGNAVSLGRALGLIIDGPFGEYKKTITGTKGKFPSPVTAQQLKDKLEILLNRTITLSTANPQGLINSLAIITGGANSNWIEAYEQGIDAYITGEMREHDWYDSQEHGVHMFAAGHNATEEFGIKALKQKIERELHLECHFYPSENPV